MKRIEEVMTKEQRQQFASRVEVLEKVKAMKVLASVAYYYSFDVVAATNEFVVAAYQLDRIETPEGTKYNEGICRTRKMTPDEMRRPVVKQSLIPARVAL